MLLSVLILVRSLPSHFYSRSSTTFTASMEPNPLVPARCMETPEVNRPVVPSRERLEKGRLLKPDCAKVFRSQQLLLPLS